MALSRLAFPLMAAAALAGCMSPMTQAAKTGDVAGVNNLIAAGQSPSAQDGWQRTPMYWAAYYHHDAVVAALIKGGAVPDNESVRLAFYNDDQPLARMMVKAGGPVPQEYAAKLQAWKTSWDAEDAARAAAAQPAPDAAPAPASTQEKPWWAH